MLTASVFCLGAIAVAFTDWNCGTIRKMPKDLLVAVLLPITKVLKR